MQGDEDGDGIAAVLRRFSCRICSMIGGFTEDVPAGGGVSRVVIEGFLKNWSGTAGTPKKVGFGFLRSPFTGIPSGTAPGTIYRMPTRNHRSSQEPMLE
jgi:hypothetical protein